MLTMNHFQNTIEEYVLNSHFPEYYGFTNYLTKGCVVW